jgi:hypothetical protein
MFRMMGIKQFLLCTAYRAGGTAAMGSPAR